jgi:thiol-disulfide isomerase/thioredoxin
MRLHNVLALVACMMLVTTVHAQRSQLKVGDEAPALDIAQWVKGDSTAIEKDQVYVIEFWATWCGPCRAAIPHLSELQRRYEADGLRIIGVSTEDKDVVERFVRSQGQQIAYTIAVDSRNTTERNWMTAAGQRGIPTSFIVDQRGRIQFIGNPHSSEFSRVLGLVMNGRYDAVLLEEATPILDAADNARRVRNWRQAFGHLDKAIEMDRHIFAPLELTKFEIMMHEMEDPDTAYRHARSIIRSYSDDPGLLLRLAEMVASDPKISTEHRDMKVASDAVEAAVRASRNRNDPYTLSVQALVHYHNGEKDRAVSLQRRAWMIATPARKPGYERVLRRYQEAASASSNSSTPQRGGSFR